MIKAIKIPEEFIAGTAEEGSHYFRGPEAKKRVLTGIDEIQYLYVAPRTAIKMHGHNNQWEVWLRIPEKTANICAVGEEHELVNDSDRMLIIMAIKGHVNYPYEDLAGLLYGWGFSVTHGSLLVNSEES